MDIVKRKIPSMGILFTRCNYDPYQYFPPKSRITNSYSLFLRGRESRLSPNIKTLNATEEKAWAFVINVVEIQICPPKKRSLH